MTMRRKEVQLVYFGLSLDSWGQLILTKGSIAPEQLSAALEKIAPGHEDIPTIIEIQNAVLVAIRELEQSLDNLLDNG